MDQMISSCLKAGAAVFSTAALDNVDDNGDVPADSLKALLDDVFASLDMSVEYYMSHQPRKCPCSRHFKNFRISDFYLEFGKNFRFSFEKSPTGTIS